MIANLRKNFLNNGDGTGCQDTSVRKCIEGIPALGVTWGCLTLGIPSKSDSL